MNDKKADNTIIIKKKLAIIEDNISVNNKKLHDIEYTEELFNTLHKKLDRCAGILNRSMKSKRTTALVADIEESNNVNKRKMQLELDNERELTKLELRKSKEEHEMLKRELKKIMNEEEKESEKKDEQQSEETNKIGRDSNENSIN